jgi:hypothetical protein
MRANYLKALPLKADLATLCFLFSHSRQHAKTSFQLGSTIIQNYDHEPIL